MRAHHALLLIFSATIAFAEDAIKYSDWGEVVNGVQLRIAEKLTVEQGLPVDISFEIRSEPDKLSGKSFNIDPYLQRNVQIRCSNAAGKEITFSPVIPASPFFGMIDPKTLIDIRKAPISQSELIDTVRVTDDLIPGEYQCKLEFSVNELKQNPHNLWHGTILSGNAKLTVLPPTPHPKKVNVPRQLKLMTIGNDWLEFGFTKDDAEEVELPVRNGFFLGTAFGESGLTNALPEPGDLGNMIQFPAQTKTIDTEIEISIFETMQPAGHMWMPQGKENGYKVLWTRKFKLKATKEEIEEMLAKK